MPSQAHLVHRARGRLRLRIPERRHDRAFFAELEERLLALPGVTAVSANPETAGVLILTAADPAPDPVPAIDSTGLVRVVDTPPPPPPALDTLRGLARRVDQSLDEFSDGALDLSSLAVHVLLVLAIRQAAKGQILGSAASLFWYAAEITRHRQQRPQTQPKTSPDQ